MCSSWKDVISSVPQGSVHGPILIVIFINTLTDVIEDSEIYLFADDNKLYRAIFNDDDSIKLQDDINRMFHWSTNSLLKFHSSGLVDDQCVSISIEARHNTSEPRSR